MLKRRIFLSGMMSSLALPGLANVETVVRPRPRPGPPEPVAVLPETDRIIAEAALGGQVAVMLMDARDGRILVDRNSHAHLPPASVAKAITTGYALDYLGAGYRFSTRVIATGPLRDGVLDGDLVLAGGGAPGLSTDALAEIVRFTAETGLREITGRLLWWDGFLPQIAEIEPGQPDHLGYNPSVSGLNLNFNRVHFDWRLRGGNFETKLDARSASLFPEVSVIQSRLADRNRPIFVHGEDPDTGNEVWSVARSALGNGGARWLPVRDSGAYAADVFRTLAQTRGIVLPEPEEAATLPEGTVVASLPSSHVADVAKGMLRFSTNLTAEVLGLTATLHRTGAMPADLPASGVEMTSWMAEALGMGESSFVDHSGLSGENRTSPADLCAGLHTLGIDGQLRPLLREYVLTDDAGQPEPMLVAAKTGTLNFVSCLAGYIEPEDSPPLIFAIQTADLDRRAAIPEGDEDNPPGTSYWTGRSRRMQFDLVKLWGRYAGMDPALQG